MDQVSHLSKESLQRSLMMSWRFHMEQSAAAKVAAGIPEWEARRQAAIEFGAVEATWRRTDQPAASRLVAGNGGAGRALCDAGHPCAPVVFGCHHCDDCIRHRREHDDFYAGERGAIQAGSGAGRRATGKHYQPPPESLTDGGMRNGRRIPTFRITRRERISTNHSKQPATV